jgi:hypothetical protein
MVVILMAPNVDNSFLQIVEMASGCSIRNALGQVEIPDGTLQIVVSYFSRRKQRRYVQRIAVNAKSNTHIKANSGKINEMDLEKHCFLTL